VLKILWSANMQEARACVHMCVCTCIC